MNEKIKQLLYLARLNKPIGIYLLLWPTLWGLWLAGKGEPDVLIVVIFILGVVLMRSAGCVINDIADYKKDGFVERTRLRPLVTKKVSIKEALLFFSILLIAAFILVCLTNRLTVLLAFCGALIAIAYPFLKRVTHLPQLGLGVAFSWSIPMAFAAINNTIPHEGWLLFTTALLWPIIYDTQYAMTDRQDDIQIGVKSTAILFGQWDRIIISLLQLLFLLLLVVIGFVFQLNVIYFLSLLLVSVLFIYQQWLIKDRLRERCFQAFLNNNWVGCLIFLGMALG